MQATGKRGRRVQSETKQRRRCASVGLACTSACQRKLLGICIVAADEDPSCDVLGAGAEGCADRWHT